MSLESFKDWLANLRTSINDNSDQVIDTYLGNATDFMINNPDANFSTFQDYLLNSVFPARILIPDWLSGMYSVGKEFLSGFVAVYSVFSIIMSWILFFISNPYLSLLVYECFAICYVVIKIQKEKRRNRLFDGHEMIVQFLIAQIWLIHATIFMIDFLVENGTKLVKLVIERLPFIGN